MKINKEKFRNVLFFGLLFLSLIYFDYNRGGTTEDYWGNPNEKSRIYSAVSLIETGEFSFDNLYNETTDMDWPTVMDYAVSPRNGREYSDKAPLTVLLAIPLYGIWKIGLLIAGAEPQLYSTMLWMRIWLATVPFLLSAFLLFKILRKYVTEEKAYLGIFIYIFATMNASFSFIAMGHVMTELFVVLILYFTLVKQKRFLAGLFAGLMVITEYPFAMAALAFFVYFLITDIKSKNYKNIRYFVAGTVPAFLILAGYNWIVWGNVFSLSYQFVEGKGIVEEAFYHFSLKQTFEVLAGSSRGVFFYSSVFLFSIVGAVRMFKEKKWEALLFTIITGLFLVFLFGYKEYPGGWSPGIRHLIPTYPMWIILISYAIKDFEKEKGVFRVAFFAALALSVLLNILPKMSYVFYPDKIPNPSYWAGFYTYFGWTIETLFYGYGKFFIKNIIYLILFASLIIMFFKYKIKLSFEKKYWTSVGVFALLTVGIIIMPQTYSTESLSNIFYFSQNSPQGLGRTMLAFYNGDKARIKTEFESNQEYAEILLHQVQAYNTALKTAQIQEEYLDFWSVELYDAQAEGNLTEAKLYTKYTKSLKYSWKKVNRYLLLHEGDDEVDADFEAEVRAKLAEYNLTATDNENKEEAREKFEFIYYAYALDYLWQNQWDNLEIYMMLKKEWW